MSSYIRGDRLVVLAVSETKYALGFRPGDTCTFLRVHPDNPALVQVKFESFEMPVFFELEDLAYA